MEKCGETLAKLGGADDEQRCVLVNQMAQCFKESPECAEEIKQFVQSLASVSCLFKHNTITKR